MHNSPLSDRLCCINQNQFTILLCLTYMMTINDYSINFSVSCIHLWQIFTFSCLWTKISWVFFSLMKNCVMLQHGPQRPSTNNSAGVKEPLKPGEQATSLPFSSPPTHGWRIVCMWVRHKTRPGYKILMLLVRWSLAMENTCFWLQVRQQISCGKIRKKKHISLRHRKITLAIMSFSNCAAEIQN